MKDTKDILEEHGERRRAFVTKSAKVAAAAPAIALLLSQTSIPAYAGLSGNGGGTQPTEGPTRVTTQP